MSYSITIHEATQNFEFLISLFSLLISGYAVYCANKSSNRSLESDYFNKLLQHDILIEIPKARSEMEILHNEIKGFDHLDRVIQNIRNKCLYYKYIDVKFYTDINASVIAIQDLLYGTPDNNQLDVDKYTYILEKEIKKLYRICNEKYLG